MLDSVVFPKDFFVSINELPENEQLKTYKAIFNYCFLDKEPSEPLTGTAKIIYTMSKPQIVAKKQKRSRKETNDDSPRKEIPDIDFVNITELQYSKLCDKYGKDIIDKGITILDTWLGKRGKTAKECIGKNHYYFFRSDSWVINEARGSINKGFNWGI